ncbi:MAG: DUF3313 family protein [Gammaproteobacteria bacterium]
MVDFLFGKKLSMNTIGRICILALTLMSVIGVSGCATKGLPVEGNVTSVDISGFERDDSDAPTVVYRRPGAPGLGEFNRFIIDPVQVRYDDPKMQELSPDQIARMQQYLLEAMIKELEDGGYQIGTRSEAGKLRVSFTLTGLKAPTALPNVTAALAPIAVSVGEASVEAVFRDGLTDRVEAVALTRARGSRWLNPSPWSTWADVQKFFDGWAKGFRESVDEAHAP